MGLLSKAIRILLFISMLISTFSYSEEKLNMGTVGWLVNACNPLSNDANLQQAYDIGYCHGAIGNSIGYLYVIQSDPKYGIEIPNNINVKQLKAVFTKWAKNNPEKWHVEEHIGIILASKEAFPYKLK